MTVDNPQRFSADILDSEPMISSLDDMRDTVVHGDCRDVLKGLADACCDAVVTDPPYALTSTKDGTKGFMSAHWDNGLVAHDPAFWAEVRRVVKPGAHLVAFGGTRTAHRLAVAIEDAGWDIRDTLFLLWCHGQGFPKSVNLGEGRGSALKPSVEPIVLARAPLAASTLSANVLEHGAGALNIDACRVGTSRDVPASLSHNKTPNNIYGTYGGGAVKELDPHQGRWPSNLLFSHVGGPDGCQPAGVRRVRGTQPGSPQTGRRASGFAMAAAGHKPGHADADGYEEVSAWACVDGCPVAELDRQAGPTVSRSGGLAGAIGYHAGGTGAERGGHNDAGGPSRFFPTFAGAPDPLDAVPFRYQSKASRRDRGEGNTHPTAKSTELMRWLCRLVTPPGGLILDPFAGSASTALAAMREGFHFIAIEQDAQYVEIARHRLAAEMEKRRGD